MRCGWEWDDVTGMWRLGGSALAVEEPPESGTWWASVWRPGDGPGGKEAGPFDTHHDAIAHAEALLAGVNT